LSYSAFGVTAASLVGLLLLPSMPQDQHYHQFADQRAPLGIPNFWNVLQIFLSLRSVPPGCGDFVMIRQLLFCFSGFCFRRNFFV
jgi:hypothetical protein